MRIKIRGASKEENTELRNYVYCEVCRAGRCFRGEEPSSQFHPSKEATTRRRLAQKCKELVSELRRYDPPAADSLTEAGEGLLIDAKTFAEHSETTKQHSQHPENHHILLVMGRIHQYTGIFHDSELRELLTFAGINLSLEALRQLRARTNIPPKKLRQLHALSR
jgi:hypothetical protein